MVQARSAAAGLITLLRTKPTILSALRGWSKTYAPKAPAIPASSRIDRESDAWYRRSILIGRHDLGPLSFPHRKARTIGTKLSPGIFVVVFGFLFVRPCRPYSGSPRQLFQSDRGMALPLCWHLRVFSSPGDAPKYAVSLS